MNRFKPIKLVSVAGLRYSCGAPRIGIVAVGSTATAMLRRLAGQFPDLYRAIEINTEGEDTSMYGVYADQTILIGEKHQKPALAHEARAMAIAHEPTIEAALKPFDLVVILAGMGGSLGRVLRRSSLTSQHVLGFLRSAWQSRRLPLEEHSRSQTHRTVPMLFGKALARSSHWATTNCSRTPTKASLNRLTRHF